jgi:hypothetical protein
MNDQQRAAMQMALNVLEELSEVDSGSDIKEAITALREALAQPQGEPVAWIDPNDKTQAQYLPHIGEKVLFCHDGVTYYGNHTGGCFRTGMGITSKDFNTWKCHWMYPPAAAIRSMK